MQDNAGQHTGGAALAANKKMVHPDFFGEDGGRNPSHSDSEIDDCK